MARIATRRRTIRTTRADPRSGWHPRARSLVGFSLSIPTPHSISDIEEEVNSINTEMTTFGQEMRSQVFHQKPDGTYAYAPGSTAGKISLYERVWRPLMDEWGKFYLEHHDSFWQNLPLGGAWDRAQDFRSRLVKLRDQARKERFALQTPDPTPPKTDEVDLKKIAVVAGAGLAGLALLLLVTRR